MEVIFSPLWLCHISVHHEAAYQGPQVLFERKISGDLTPSIRNMPVKKGIKEATMKQPTVIKCSLDTVIA